MARAAAAATKLTTPVTAAAAELVTGLVVVDTGGSLVTDVGAGAEEEGREEGAGEDALAPP